MSDEQASATTEREQFQVALVSRPQWFDPITRPGFVTLSPHVQKLARWLLEASRAIERRGYPSWVENWQWSGGPGDHFPTIWLLRPRATRLVYDPQSGEPREDPTQRSGLRFAGVDAFLVFERPEIPPQGFYVFTSEQLDDKNAESEGAVFRCLEKWIVATLPSAQRRP